MSRILIVDDQPHLRELFSLELLDEGHQVHGTNNAKEVQRCIRETKPDLVLLDLYLNGFEGWDVLVSIKKTNPQIPVLIVTAYDNYMDDPRLSSADGYFVKSFIELDKIKAKIAALLGRKAAVEQE